MCTRQCFFGDQKTGNPGSVSLSECNTVCPGDDSEVCGGQNRILVYQGPEPVLLTLPEAVEQLQDYNDLLVEFLQAVQNWDNAIKAYSAALAAAGSAGRSLGNVRRQVDAEVLRTFRESVNHEADVKRIEAERGMS